MQFSGKTYNIATSIAAFINMDVKVVLATYKGSETAVWCHRCMTENLKVGVVLHRGSSLSLVFLCTFLFPFFPFRIAYLGARS